MSSPGPETSLLTWEEIAGAEVEAGSIALWWLYQAGFIIKSSGGTTIAVDPYLSDAVMRSYNQPRAVAPPILPSQLPVDAVLATHPHEDHLDPDSIEAFAAHPALRFVGPESVAQVLSRCGIAADRTQVVHAGLTSQGAQIGDIMVQAVFARHMYAAEPTPDAVGFLLDVGGVTIYHAGDTEYDSRICADTRGVDISLVCINGTTGNMNAYEAALLVFQQQAAIGIPMHYGLWRDEDYGPGATLDPSEFADTLGRLVPSTVACIPRPGQLLMLRPRK